MKVHEKIRFLRQSKNWSQGEIAEKLSMTESGYAKIEQGKTDIHFSKLEKIAQVFELSIVELLSFGEKNMVFVVGDNSNNGVGNNSVITGSVNELAFEIQKLQLIVSHKNQIIEQKDTLLAQKDKYILSLEQAVEQLRNHLHIRHG